jgi:hypothetical protein
MITSQDCAIIFGEPVMTPPTSMLNMRTATSNMGNGGMSPLPGALGPMPRRASAAPKMTFDYRGECRTR